MVENSSLSLLVDSILSHLGARLFSMVLNETVKLLAFCRCRGKGLLKFDVLN